MIQIHTFLSVHTDAHTQTEIVVEILISLVAGCDLISV